MSSTTFFFLFLSIIVLGGLALSGYLVGRAAWQNYKYKKFELPVYDELLLDANKEKQELVNPLEVTKFNISSTGKNEFIQQSRESSEKMHKFWAAQEQEKERIRLKKMKKELSKKKDD